MDPEFKAWLKNMASKWPRETKDCFLDLAKHNPEQARNVIAQNLEGWGHAYVIKVNKPVVCQNPNSEAQEVFEMFKELYAEELGAMK